MMKGLSLWQPWASLVAVGAKEYETRCWKTGYRGEIALCASKGWTRNQVTLCCRGTIREALSAAGFDVPLVDQPHPEFVMRGRTKYRFGLPTGVVVAVVDLVACLPTETLAGQLSARERDLGDFRPGRWAWRLARVRRLTRPVPVVGFQGLWTLDSAIESRVRDALS